MNHERVVAQLAAWAHDDDNIRAAVLTGSLARGEGDDLSDVDIELFVLEANSDAEFQTAAGDHINHCYILGKAHGIVKRHQYHP